MIRKWNNAPKEVERKCIDEIITRIQESPGDAGMITAQDIIDIVTTNYGPSIYNAGVQDAKQAVQDNFYDLEASIDSLQYRP